MLYLIRNLLKNNKAILHHIMFDNTLQSLFTKHAVKNGKIIVERILYVNNRKVSIQFNVFADKLKETFVTIVPFFASHTDLLDRAFEEIYKEVDDWLEIARQLDAAKNSLEGKVVFNSPYCLKSNLITF